MKNTIFRIGDYVWVNDFHNAIGRIFSLHSEKYCNVIMLTAPWFGHSIVRFAEFLKPLTDSEIRLFILER